VSVDWQKLKTDLIAAREAAQAVPNAGDGGSANNDAASVVIPRVRGRKVQDVARSAGLGCSERTRFGTRVFLLNSPKGGQGDHNTQQAEAMVKVLKARGWAASMWWQID